MEPPPMDPRVWRYHAARWPIPVREKFGEFANFYESKGLDWKNAEYRAYLKIEEILKAQIASKPGFVLPVHVVPPETVVVIEPEPGTVAVVAERKKWRRARASDTVLAAVTPDPEAAAFFRAWNRDAAASWDRAQAARVEEERKVAEKAQARLEKTSGAYSADRVPARKKGRRRKADPANKVLAWEPS